MHGSLEDIDGAAVRAQSDKLITFVSGVIASALTTTLVTAVPLAAVDMRLGEEFGSLALLHAVPLSVLMVALLMTNPGANGAKGYAERSGLIGAAAASAFVLLYVALGVLGTVLASPLDLLLMVAPVVGGFFGGMAAGRVMQEPLLPAVVQRDEFDPEEDRVIANPKSWADRTEGWTRDPRG